MRNINNPRVKRYSGPSLAFMIVIILVLGCGRLGRSPSGVETKIKNLTVPTFDPKEPFPALSTSAFDALSAEVPELARHREAVLAAERAAIKGALDDFRSKSKAANTRTGYAIPESAGSRLPDVATLPRTKVDSSSLVNYDQPGASIDGLFDLTPVAMAAESDLSSLGFTQQMLIGHQIGFFMADNGDFKTTKGSKTIEMKDEKSGEVQASMTLSIDKDGGPMTMELTTKVSMPLFGLDANSKVAITGDLCPNSDGKVDITVKGASNGRAGSSGSVIYDKNLEARIMVTVGDDANVVGADLDLRQASRSTAGGRQVYVDTSQAGRLTSDQYSKLKFGEFKINRASSKVTPADQQVSDDGIAAAYYLAIGALESAKTRWQNGGCVEILATSPGTVAPDSNTSIPVKVRHKFGGSEVPSKLDAALTGRKSVDPTRLAKTSGTLTYTAPSETGKSATIKLTATSRRGRATLDLTANTGGKSYRVSGASNGVNFSGEICSLDKPFVINGTFANGSETQTFTPSSSTSGTVQEAGNSGGCTQSGGGTYKVTLNEQGSGTLEFTETVTGVCGAFSNTRTVTFKVSLTPASGLSCP